MRQVLDLPRNLVREGFEKVRELGMRLGQAGRSLGQEFALLKQVPAAMLRPFKAALDRLTRHEDPLEPSLEKTLIPRFGPRIGR
jgi:hypothetical protein